MTKTEELSIKQTVRERDGMQFVACGMINERHIELCGTQLQVHRKQGKAYNLENCETLCNNCHDSTHLLTKERKQKVKRTPGITVVLSDDFRHALLVASKGKPLGSFIRQVMADYIGKPELAGMKAPCRPKGSGKFNTPLPQRQQ